MTHPHATVEVEISEDMQLVHFDFNSTPFEPLDNNYVLREMKCCERPGGDNVEHNFTADRGESSSTSGMNQSQALLSLVSNPVDGFPASPPLPGILKARVKLEH
ncbi:Transcription factor-like protein DPB [Quillaja saponaria]|uniref:Transcription factor-like protein DPB n=1 Tax=Quillaja saponaria TaxID=32244 RepID=A0AAD7LCB8_QUISA|nr:Transcription factor-like protein DPB [Quillaja saponaria]